jgi:hypothetical protein
VHHGLLVARLVVAQRGRVGQFGLEQGLADARDVAMPEDAEASLEQLVLEAVTLAALYR